MVSSVCKLEFVIAGDIKRLATSVVVAGRHNRLSLQTCQDVARSTVRAYREHMAEYAQMTALAVWYAHIDVKFLLDFSPRSKEQKQMKQSVKQAEKLTTESLLSKSTAMEDGNVILLTILLWCFTSRLMTP